MLKTVLEKISNVIEAEFLYGSFLPVLIFVSSLTVTLAGVLGYEACFTWAGGRTGAEKAVYPVAITLTLIVFAYVLSALRPLILAFWTGLPCLGPFRRMLTAFARRRFEERSEEAESFNDWAGMPEWFAEEAQKNWTKGVNDACECELKEILADVDKLSVDAGAANVKASVQKIFLDQLDARFTGKSLSKAYTAIRKKLLEWTEAEAFRGNSLRWKLDRDFGPLECIRPTHLGNIIESYNSYSFSRYGIEPEVFWPHLQCQLDADVRKPMETTHTIVDFSLAMTTFAVLYALLCLFAGPWLWSHAVVLWLVLAVVGCMVAFTTYQVALTATDQYGDLFRAAFDLHRFELLSVFRRPVPLSHGAEKEMWEELSRLVVYGETTNFVLVAPPVSTFGAPSS